MTTSTTTEPVRLTLMDRRSAGTVDMTRAARNHADGLCPIRVYVGNDASTARPCGTVRSLHAVNGELQADLRVPADVAHALRKGHYARLDNEVAGDYVDERGRRHGATIMSVTIVPVRQFSERRAWRQNPCRIDSAGRIVCPAPERPSGRRGNPGGPRVRRFAESSRGRVLTFAERQVKLVRAFAESNAATFAKLGQSPDRVVRGFALARMTDRSLTAAQYLGNRSSHARQLDANAEARKHAEDTAAAAKQEEHLSGTWHQHRGKLGLSDVTLEALLDEFRAARRSNPQLTAMMFVMQRARRPVGAAA